MANTYKYCDGHVEVFDGAGRFLFSADNIREAREEMKLYPQLPEIFLCHQAKLLEAEVPEKGCAA